MPKEVTNSSPKARSMRSPRKVPSTGSQKAQSVSTQSKVLGRKEGSVVAPTVKQGSVGQLSRSKTEALAGRPRDSLEEEEEDVSMEQRITPPCSGNPHPGPDRGGEKDSYVMLEEEYEDDEALEHEHSEQEWMAFEKRFSSTNIMVAFSINEPTVAIPERGYWGLRELSMSIVKVCGSKGVQFEAPGLVSIDGKLTILLGRPKANSRELWKLLRKGYIKVLGAVIWVAPDFTGRKQSNLDLIELEYSNPNYENALLAQ